MENKYCQSCGMPLQNQDELGTNSDGSIYDGLHNGANDRALCAICR